MFVRRSTLLTALLTLYSVGALTACDRGGSDGGASTDQGSPDGGASTDQGGNDARVPDARQRDAASSDGRADAAQAGDSGARDFAVEALPVTDAVAECPPGFHLEGAHCVANVCAPNTTQTCQVDHGTGSQLCNADGSAWGACGNLTSCDPGYRLANGACPAIHQPPLEFDSADKLGIDITCNMWGMDAAALADCSADLDLIKGLGVGLVRIPSAWFLLTAADGTLDPAKVAFTKALLNAARARGMKVLFLVGLPAPASAYQCPATQQPPAGPSLRLDFCDAAFSAFFSGLMDIVLPFTGHVELFNETNWNYSETTPTYTSVSPAGYIIDRSVWLHNEARRILQQKAAQGYQTALHTQGIAYFYNSKYPTRGWTPPASMPLIEAESYLYWVYQAGGNSLGAVDVVDFHPYATAADYKVLVDDFVLFLSGLVGYKYLWATETNSGGAEADQVAVFNSLTTYLDANWIQKGFWYVVRQGYANSEGDQYALYDINRNLIKPTLAAAIKAYAARVPYEQRFLPSTYGPVE